MSDLKKSIEDILEKSDKSFDEKIEMIQEIEQLLHKKNDEENNIYLKRQIKEVRDAYSEIEKTHQIKRPDSPLWIINLNYNDLKEMGVLDESNIDSFEKALRGVINHYSYSVGKSQGFGKKTILFDSLRSFKIFIGFLHSREFVYELNQLCSGFKVSLSNRTFHIKVAKIKKQDSIDEIAEKMNDSFMPINENENDYCAKETAKNIRKYLGEAISGKKINQDNYGILEKMMDTAKKLKGVAKKKIDKKKARKNKTKQGA